MKTATVILLALLVPVAALLSFFGFMFRADNWEEVAGARMLHFLLIGPLWGTIVFLSLVSKFPARKKSAIVAGCLGYLISATSLSGWNALVLTIREGPNVANSDAERNLQVVQAICNYRAEKGMLPYSLDDLVPKYLNELPDGRRLHWASRRLFLGGRLLYRFDKDGEGWVSTVNLPKVAPTRPALGGNALIQARLAEYDRRIAKGHETRQHYLDKIAYLLSINRRSEARTTCKAASVAFPESWQPLMGLAILAEGNDHALAEKQLRACLDKHPAFTRCWCLSRYYRDLGRHDEAIEALRQAAKCPIDYVEENMTFTPEAFAFDAVKYAYQQHQYELVLRIAEVMSPPGDNNATAFRAAAELALGRINEAREHINFVCSNLNGRVLWAENLQALQQAAARGDRSFVYDPGNTANIDSWTLFPSSEDSD